MDQIDFDLSLDAVRVSLRFDRLAVNRGWWRGMGPRLWFWLEAL